MMLDLRGQILVISFMTVAELERYLQPFVILPFGRALSAK
jgi:hypothetical protein